MVDGEVQKPDLRRALYVVRCMLHAAVAQAHALVDGEVRKPELRQLGGDRRRDGPLE